jgi:hypothetical protein
MSIVTTTVADDEPQPNNVGELGKFRLKKLTKFIKPLTSIAQPLMSMGKGGGLLTAMGPWGWAAGAVLAAGGTAAAMAARHQRKKRLAREQQQQEQAAAAAAAQYNQSVEPPPMTPPSYDQPSADASYPPPNMPTPEAMTLPESPPFDAPIPSADVATPFPISMQPAEPPPPPSIDISEVQAVLDPEMQAPAMNGLAADGQPTAALDWQTIGFIAGLGLGGWWLLSNHQPTRTKRR